ncbi:hypothetical protein Ddye_016850 [Dipteronia dyeriana]|uniref:Uncharacterized protein n=1 Tax=Dipteronia dyeriana TaxID=168575 RepID=A0AAD9U7J0_9ROSI|nr:hypothetical protein Ddye_016850 [Dipteronia dyeriana]
MNFNVGGPSTFSSPSLSSDKKEEQLLANIEAMDAEQEAIFAQHADAVDEYIKIGKSITIESLKRFCCAVVEEFTGEYLRSHNSTNVARLLCIGKDCGFPRILGRLNCMHWK